ncbi:YkvA family protein [Streptococcus plurextorum]|uniref:YkvA family protein n=1 Tax=Streptococcus plurextorum TaxID=456876 RepID=UPI00041E3641|nr:DUF1232 domain-containing protein [Streptococcus plurextorum]
MPIPIPKLPNRLTQTAKNWADKQKEELAQVDLKEKFDLALQSWKSKKTEAEAAQLLADSDKMEEFLQGVELKLKKVPFAGENLAVVPGMISLIRSYIKRDYQEVPKGVLLATVGALIYFFSPVDALPDFLLGPGLLDDAFVLGACLKLIKSDLSDFRDWQASQTKLEE